MKYRDGSSAVKNTGIRFLPSFVQSEHFIRIDDPSYCFHSTSSSNGGNVLRLPEK